MSNSTQQNHSPYLRAKDAASYLSIGVSTLWLWARKGIIPKPIRLGNRCSVWAREDLEAFLSKMKAEGARV